MQKKWFKNGADFRVGDLTDAKDLLPNGIYSLEIDKFGPYLTLIMESFKFEFKLYDVEHNFINKVIKTYENTTGNLGVLLTGVRGTGKSVTAKLICNELKDSLPVILINKRIEGTNEFLSSIEQNVILFFDEFEKLKDPEEKWNESNKDLLTLMDGVYNSKYRKLFLMTTNELHINDNFFERPSRIRYIKKFTDLTYDGICELVDDILVDKSFREDCIEVISELNIITIDIIKALIQEVNIHNESPKKFIDIFNVKKIEQTYDIFEMKDKNSQYSLGINVNSINITPSVKKLTSSYQQSLCINQLLYINHECIGKIKEFKGINSLLLQKYVYDNKLDQDTYAEELTEIQINSNNNKHSSFTMNTRALAF